MIYSDRQGPLFSSIGVGPRGNGIYLSSKVYEYQNSNVYTCNASDYMTEQRGSIHNIRVGDVVVFKTQLSDISKFNLGVVDSVVGDKITFTSRSEINVGTYQELADESVTSDKLADNSVTSDKLADNSVGSSALDLTGVTSGLYGDTSNQTPDFGDTFKSVSFSVDADGRLNDAKEHTIKIPIIPNMSAGIKGIAKVGSGLTMNGDSLELDGNGDIATAVTTWLNDHPEATTTVQDNSVTDEKLVQSGGILTEVSKLNKKCFGLLGRKKIIVSNQMYQDIVVFDNISLLKDEYYHVIVTFDSAPDVSGYAILRNSNDAEIARTNSFINVTKAELVYKNEYSNSIGNKLIISFNGSGTYTCTVEMYSVWEGEVNKAKRCFGAVTFLKDDLRNGTTNNPGNTLYVSTPVMKMRGDSILVMTDRPNSADCVYRFQYRLVGKEVDDCSSDASSQLDVLLSTSNIFNFNNNNCIGVQVAIAEHDTINDVDVQLRVNDFDGYHITIFDNSAYENNIIARKNLTLLSMVKFDKTYMRNGSATNPYNLNAVAVPALKTKTSRVMVRTDRPNKPNCIYRYNFITALVDRDDFGYDTQSSDYADYVLEPIDTYEPTNENRVGVQVAIFEYNTSTNSDSPLRVSDFDGYNIYIYDVGCVPNLIEGLPKYYDEYMSERIRTICERDVDIANTGDSFIFFTDTHMENKYYSPKIAKYILDNSAVSQVVVGGDLTNQPTSKQQAIEQLSTNASLCRIVDDVVFLRGNHDTNPYGTGQLTAEEYYAIFNKHIEKHVDTNGKNYYYRDNVSQKIRYIFMDTGADGEISSTQIDWVQSVASELSSAWTIVLMAHWVVWFNDYTDMQPTNSIAAVVTALSGINAKIACIIGGHTHIDGLNDTAYSFPIIVVTCDTNGRQQLPGVPSVNRDGYSINEQSLSVFHINTSTKTIYLTRIGGGNVNVLETGDYTDNDRIFTYI